MADLKASVQQQSAGLATAVQGHAERIGRRVGLTGTQTLLGATGLVLGGLFFGVIFLGVVVYVLFLQPPQADRASFSKLQTGMTEEQVEKIMGKESRVETQPDGSVRKTWDPIASNNGPMHVVFAGGHVTSKVHEEPTGGKTANAGASTDSQTGGEMANADKAFLDGGTNAVDQQLAAAAIQQHKAGIPWSEVDSTMSDASPKMLRAYKKWKAACDANEK